VTLLQIVVLAVVQGITEFLPISSSGHLILVPILAGWPDQGLLIDVAVHVGTLVAVLGYLWRDIVAMVLGLGRALRGRHEPGARLVGLLVVATLPVVIAGFAVNAWAGDALRSVAVIGWATLGFGVVLHVADRVGLTVRRIEHLRWADAIIVGLAQILALVPGTSRAGITMTAARLLGFERLDTARFSMLLSIPAILGAGALKGVELYQAADAALTATAALAAALAAASALVAILAMMAWLRRASFAPFVVYRVLLGAGLLVYAYL
jgi:undecaprenyl-diphosphatase